MHISLKLVAVWAAFPLKLQYLRSDSITGLTTAAGIKVNRALQPLWFLAVGLTTVLAPSPPPLLPLQVPTARSRRSLSNADEFRAG